MTLVKNTIRIAKDNIAMLFGAALICTAMATMIFYVIPTMARQQSEAAEKAYAPLEQKVLTQMANDTQITFRNEQFKIAQYDMETRKVLLRGKTGELIVSVERLAN